jgi:hypothetical protein
VMISSRDRPFKQDVSDAEHPICELKNACKVCCVVVERKP